jgi:hypothetical protein
MTMCKDEINAFYQCYREHRVRGVGPRRRYLCCRGIVTTIDLLQGFLRASMFGFNVDLGVFLPAEKKPPPTAADEK